MGLEFWFTGYWVIGAFILIFGLVGLLACMGDGDTDTRTLSARFVLFAAVWPLVIAFWLYRFSRWVWKVADL